LVRGIVASGIEVGRHGEMSGNRDPPRHLVLEIYTYMSGMERIVTDMFIAI